MKKLSITFLLAVIICACFVLPASAAEYTAKVDDTTYKRISVNTSYKNKTTFQASSTLTVTSEEEIDSFYVVWYSTPKAWVLNDNQTIDDGMLHQYIKLDSPAKSFTMTMPDEKTSMCYLKVFAKGEEVPADIQQWNEPTENVDVMVFAAHADDESLFFGAAIATILNSHPDANVQLVTFTTHASSEPYREHERLDAMWALGLTNYPIVGDVKDTYSTTLEGGLKCCDYDAKVTEYVELINKYKPQVILTQDFNGEYGHGQHMVLTKVVCEAYEKAAESGHKVSKLYVHLAEDNQILIDCQVPLDAYEGKTAVEVAKAAYLKHDSQQYCWFYVTDKDTDYKGNLCNCAKWGLYKTNVGVDTTADLMENIKTYNVQAQEAAAKAAEEAAKEEQSSVQHQEAVQNGIKISKLVLAVIFVVVIILIVIVIKLIIKANKKAKANAPRHAKPKK